MSKHTHDSMPYSIRFPNQLVAGLRILSHRESLRRGRTISWHSLLKECAEEMLRRDAENVDMLAGAR